MSRQLLILLVSLLSLLLVGPAAGADGVERDEDEDEDTDCEDEDEAEDEDEGEDGDEDEDCADGGTVNCGISDGTSHTLTGLLVPLALVGTRRRS